MDAQRLGKVLALAASDNDSEARHALATARRLLEAEGLDFVSLAARLANAPASSGADAGRIDELEDTIFDLRNEIRHLRAENARLKLTPATAAGPAASPPANLAEAAHDAAAVIRLRAELAAARDGLEASREETLRHQAVVAGLNARLAAAEAEAERLEAEARELRARRDRHDAELRRATNLNRALEAELNEATAERDRLRAAALVPAPAADSGDVPEAKSARARRPRRGKGQAQLAMF